MLAKSFDRSMSHCVRPVNGEVIRCASLAMYCDYVVENLHDAEHLTWLVVNHVNDIVDQLHETPVQDLMGYESCSSHCVTLYKLSR